MKQFLFCLLTITFVANNLKAQPTEKFMKLNRIVVLDSTKSKTITTQFQTIFSITVPAGMYWKVESINFTPSFDQTTYVTSPAYMRVKVNNIDLLQPYNQTYNNQTSSSSIPYYPFLKNTPFWVGPGMVISAYGNFPAYYNNPQISFDFLINAMEFIVE